MARENTEMSCGCCKPNRATQVLSSIALLALCAVSPLLARGTPEEAWEPVEGTEHWGHEVDLTGLDPGRYNLIVRGFDRAGNETIAGPVDLRVDPDAFVPATTFMAPDEGQVLRDDVNIVGAVSYRGDIDRVEVRLNDGPWTEVDGAAYWSKRLDAESLEDGVHTIEARATGAGERVGPTSVRTFVFDRDVPEIALESPREGEIVSGEVTVTGWITDAHDIDRLTMRRSVDVGGESDNEAAAFDRPFSAPQSLRLRYDSAGDQHSFSFSFDTTETVDGTILVELEAENEFGGRSTRVVPFLVHNDPPDLVVLLPEEGDSVRGVTTVTGYARSQVGISRIWYEWDDEEVDVDRIEGDRYWHFDLDPGDLSERQFQLVVYAEDELGNQSRSTVSLENAVDRSRPLIVFSSDSLEYVRTGDSLSGMFTESAPGDEIVIDDGNGSEQTFAAYPGGFSVGIDELASALGIDSPAPGDALSFTLRGRRADGLEGSKRELTLRVIGERPHIDFDHTSGETRPRDEPGKISGEIFAPAGVADASGELSLPDGRVVEAQLRLESSDSPHTARFVVPVDFDGGAPRGPVGVELAVSDNTGASHTARSFVFVGNPIIDSDEQLVFDDERVGSDGAVALTDDTLLTGRFFGNWVMDAEIIDADGLVSVSLDENAIGLVAQRDGYTDGARLRLRLAGGREYLSDPFELTVTRRPAELSTEYAPDDRFAARTVRVNGVAGGRLPDVVSESVTLRYELFVLETHADGRDGETSLEPPAGELLRISSGGIDRGGDGAFSVELDLVSVGVESGPVQLRITAEDAFGRVSTRDALFAFDPGDPQWQLVTPDVALPVYGATTLSGLWRTDTALDRVEWSLDGEMWREAPLLPHRVGGDGALSAAVSIVALDFTELSTEIEGLQLRATNRVGTTTTVTPTIEVDLDAGRPHVELQLPEEDELITRDRVLTGFAVDEEGIESIYWRLNDGAFRRLDGARSFAIPLPLSELGDNEQRVEVYAEDLFGLESERVTRTFRVSTSAPSVEFRGPTVAETVAGVTALSGTAFDANGIAEVSLSFDGGGSFHTAELDSLETDHFEESDPNATDGDAAPPEKASWRYKLDTRLFADAPAPVQIRVADSYGVVTDQFGIINIDNTRPDLLLEAPVDGRRYSDRLAIRGRVHDNTAVESVALSIEPLDGQTTVMTRQLPTDEVLHVSVDVSELETGRYTMTVTAADPAGNEARVSRGIVLTSEGGHLEPELIKPTDASRYALHVPVHGVIGGDNEVDRVTIHVNGIVSAEIPVSPFGAFAYRLTSDELRDGLNVIRARAELPGVGTIDSEERTVYFSAAGPSVSIDSHVYREPVTDRPWIEGRAAFVVPDDETAPELDRVEVSLDNGATYERARGGAEWRYRLQTHVLPNGSVSVVVRALFEDGSSASTRTLLVVDSEPPVLALRAPADGEIVADSLNVVGTASDNHSLESIEVALRSGRSGGYSVPSFIQGMYLDAHALGVTYADIGIGFSFFDDNVRLQAQYGITPPGQRFSGQVIGGKLLANIASVPFSTLLGPDWEFLSANFALGANFSYIALSEPLPGSDAPGVVLSAIVAQLEFPRFDISGWNAFNSYSLYTEPQLWFVPSDVEPSIEARLTFGLRIGLF